jgi:hypothetical protein
VILFGVSAVSFFSSPKFNVSNCRLVAFTETDGTFFVALMGEFHPCRVTLIREFADNVSTVHSNGGQFGCGYERTPTSVGSAGKSPAWSTVWKWPSTAWTLSIVPSY